MCNNIHIHTHIYIYIKKHIQHILETNANIILPIKYPSLLISIGQLYSVFFLRISAPWIFHSASPVDQATPQAPWSTCVRFEPAIKTLLERISDLKHAEPPQKKTVPHKRVWSRLTHSTTCPQLSKIQKQKETTQQISLTLNAKIIHIDKLIRITMLKWHCPEQSWSSTVINRIYLGKPSYLTMTRCSRIPTEELVSGVGAISWWFPYEPKRGRHETHETLKNNETQYPQLLETSRDDNAPRRCAKHQAEISVV